MFFFQNKKKQNCLAQIIAEDHIKINPRLVDILNLNVECNHNLYVIFATNDLLINNQ